MLKSFPLGAFPIHGLLIDHGMPHTDISFHCERDLRLSMTPGIVLEAT